MKTIKIVVQDSEQEGGFIMFLEGDKERITQAVIENPSPAEAVTVLLYNECLRVLREKGYIEQTAKH